MEQILLTVDFIHNKNILHRDLKLDNLLITKIIDTDQYDVRIADFGLATFFNKQKDGLLTHKCGTLRYIAPEILRG
jgi:serine/threonine protein kinase